MLSQKVAPTHFDHNVCVGSDSQASEQPLLALVGVQKPSLQNIHYENKTKTINQYQSSHTLSLEFIIKTKIHLFTYGLVLLEPLLNGLVVRTTGAGGGWNMPAGIETLSNACASGEC